MTDRAILVLSTLVLFAGVSAPLLFPRWSVWTRALWRLLTLVVLTLLVQRIVGSPLKPRMQDVAGIGRTWEQVVVVGWWIAAARGVTGIARLLLLLQNRSRETQILSDLIGAVVYVATALGIIDVVLAVPIGGLLATSGVVAVIIGLALQSTLADVFSGIAIDLERPYRAGNLLTIEGGIEGRVREVNWRATHIVTGGGDLAIVPNSVIAKARLVNHSLPAPLRRASVEVRLDPRVMPERCVATLDAAVRACRLHLPTPGATIAQIALKGDGATYEISFSVASSEDLSAARTELLAQVQRHLYYAAIPLAVDRVGEVPVLTPPTPADLLERSDIFGILAVTERDALAGKMVEVHLDPGDSLFRQDADADALYVLASGAIEVVRRNPGAEEVVYRLSPGWSIGAIGLITDTTYAATATALTPVRAFRLDRAAIAQAIGVRPELGSALEDLARRGKAAISADLAGRDEHGGTTADLLLSRMKAFLRTLVTDAAGDQAR